MAHVLYHHTSSEEFLESFQGKIDLLYLDTGDVRCTERDRERERARAREKAREREEFVNNENVTERESE
jgi:hypothetical protein